MNESYRMAGCRAYFYDYTLRYFVLNTRIQYEKRERKLWHFFVFLSFSTFSTTFNGRLNIDSRGWAARLTSTWGGTASKTFREDCVFSPAWGRDKFNALSLTLYCALMWALDTDQKGGDGPGYATTWASYYLSCRKLLLMVTILSRYISRLVPRTISVIKMDNPIPYNSANKPWKLVVFCRTARAFQTQYH